MHFLALCFFSFHFVIGFQFVCEVSLSFRGLGNNSNIYFCRIKYLQKVV